MKNESKSDTLYSPPVLRRGHCTICPWQGVVQPGWSHSRYKMTQNDTNRNNSQQKSNSPLERGKGGVSTRDTTSKATQ